MPLAGRVTAIVGATFLSCVLMLGIVIQDSIDGHFAEGDADELRVVSASVELALQNSLGNLHGDDFQKSLEQAVSGHHGMYYAVFDGESNMIFSTPGPQLSNLLTSIPPVKTISRDNLYLWSENGKTYRGTVVETEDKINTTIDKMTIIVAASMDFHLQFMDQFRKQLWGVLGCSSLLILLSAWFAVQVAHRPLHKISKEIGNITSEKLNLRLDPENAPADLLELVTSFNDMLARMDDVFQRLSNFSADIAHELRTPITNLSTQTQVSLSKARDSEEYQEILYSNLEEYERMTRMINDMLWLAQADNGILKPRFETLDPAIELTELFDYLGAWAEHCNINLTLEGSRPTIIGDKEMLRRALTNLLTNAIHHSTPGSSIVVRLSSDNQNIHIAVENVGDDIPAEHLPYLFERFYRADQSRQRSGNGSGAGLGLAIVNSIVDLHGGSIFARSENGKTTFEITLPISDRSLAG
tara:strand:+ start:24767 stop:26176 length:1410 start_codon:yes stop_codon:yes gene_type:complete